MKNKLMRFMQGRYGNDRLNNHLLGLSIFFMITSMIFKIASFNLISIALIIIIYFRMFSKNRSKRVVENRAYTQLINKAKSRINRLKASFKYKYLKCPHCNKETRVPRKKGKITVTCPSCRLKFDAKS